MAAILWSSVLAPMWKPTAMHIPDGFLSLPVVLACWLLSAIVIGYAVRQTNAQLQERQVPLMGVLAAFIFAGQMINFQVAGGTSGHLLGGALATILLGPWAAMLIMTAVLSVQALFFQDGGLIALGANLLFMAVLTPLISYGVYQALRKLHQWVAAGLAAWASVVIAAVGVAVALALSGTVAMGVVLPAMAGVHALIGIGEALITVGALAFIAATRADLMTSQPTAAGSGRWPLIGLAIALAVALLSPLASTSPDGLERVAEDLGFIHRAMEPLYQVIPDYMFPGVSHPVLATILAGIVGTLLMFGLTLFLAHRLRRRTVN
ncbi:MAG: energy-coupling factor ABC transporter permease [Anaerolineae bacterium]|nr:energy-coupling factor ABC transporter permease [Anaerolineae bacterium]MDW8100220.1 energy-coupling factor ABC transporter permease [Anaerolineae bacterium]